MKMQQANEIKGTVNIDGKELSLDEYARWLSLLEALEIITSKAEDQNINLDVKQDWIKPIAFQKYVRERHETMKEELIYRDDIAKHNIKFAEGTKLTPPKMATA